MSEPEAAMPKLLAWIFRRLFPGPLGDEARLDLEHDYATQRARRGAPAVNLRFIGLLLRPSTWLLAIALRRTARRSRVARERIASLTSIATPKRLPISWLDFKLGTRMLVKYPGLTVVSGLAMAFGICVGAVAFEFYMQVVHPTLPLHEGERVVGIKLFDAASRQTETRIVRDFGVWRRNLSSVTDLGAFQLFERNLVVGDERGEPIDGAAISASAFDLARVPPLVGRGLVADDEQPDAPGVVILGYELWRTRFGGDSNAVGRVVRVGDQEATVVGVMPEGFGFPWSQSLWMPLRVDPASFEPRQGPAIRVFGRLAPGATLAQAQAELQALVRSAARERPEMYEHLRPSVAPYAKSLLEVPTAVRLRLGSINGFLLLLLVLICGNVALLMFARAAAREAEIVVRTALGATRARVVGQLFVEALVLGIVAAVAGLGAAVFGLQWLLRIVGSEILGATGFPFWIHPTVSPSTLVYVAGLAVFGAAIAGVVPGLKLTRGKLNARMQRATAGGGGLSFGGIWTAVIVLQVALTVLLPGVAWLVRRDATQIRALDVGFASEEFLGARLSLDRKLSGSETRSEFSARFRRSAQELSERLEAKPFVAAAAFANSLPGTYHPWRRIEVDEGGEAPRTRADEGGPGRRVAGGQVTPDFFDLLGVGVLQGRGFNLDDTEEAARTVIVNQSFVDQVLGERNPIGRHLRYLGSHDEWDGVSLGDPPGRWYEIVGVVKDLGMTNGAAPGIRGAGFYHAVRLEDLRANWLIVRVNGDVRALASQLREVADAVDPLLRVDEILPLDRVRDSALHFYAIWFWLVVGVSSIAFLLSLAGIYAAMSFTVARRTREIGIRVALGARPSSVIATIFRRPVAQTGSGILLGLTLTFLLYSAVMWGQLSDLPRLELGGYGVFVSLVCLLACIVPTRRALAVQPTEALRVDG